MLSALVAAGIEGGYLTSPRLAMVHWQAGGRPLPAQRVSVSGESALWVDPAEIPSGSDIGKLGRALAAGRHGERDELMASTAAYSGLRWGELAALTTGQVDQAGRVITVDRQVIEVAGHLYVEAPKCRKYRKTIYPRRTPDGYPLVRKLAARIEQATAEQGARSCSRGGMFGWLDRLEPCRCFHARYGISPAERRGWRLSGLGGRRLRALMVKPLALPGLRWAVVAL